MPNFCARPRSGKLEKRLVLSVRFPEPQPIISLIEAIHEEVRSQQEEVIRAFYSRGEYELCPEYKYLEVAEEVRFGASRQERFQYVQQVNNLSMEELLSGKTVNFPKIVEVLIVITVSNVMNS